MATSDHPEPIRRAIRVLLPAHPRAAAQARAAAADFLSREGAPAGLDRYDVLLAVSELVTNAVQAGSRRIELEIALATHSLILLVEDDADGWPIEQARSDVTERGRGLAIVAHLTDRWTVEQTDIGKKVVATFVA